MTLTLIDQLVVVLPIGAAVVGIAYWAGQLDKGLGDVNKRLDATAAQTHVDDLDGRMTKMERSIAEIHQVKEIQAAQGATLAEIAKNVDRLVHLQDDGKRRERA